MHLKPLRRSVRNLYRKPIPDKAWIPELIKLFADLNICITSSPVIVRFNPYKIAFLKTDWSSKGIGWILIQPSDDNKSIKAVAHLRITGECLFELSNNGSRLKAIEFSSRSCNDNERNFHSFTGEGACGCWAIGQNRKYLLGCHFYWICDCSAIKEILEYDGSIIMICRWLQ